MGQENLWGLSSLYRDNNYSYSVFNVSFFITISILNIKFVTIKWNKINQILSVWFLNYTMFLKVKHEGSLKNIWKKKT